MVFVIIQSENLLFFVVYLDMNRSEILIKAEYMKMLQAFKLFQEKGMKVVESTFPEYRKFVADRKQKSLREVKNELSLAGQNVL